MTSSRPSTYMPPEPRRWLGRLRLQRRRRELLLALAAAQLPLEPLDERLAGDVPFTERGMERSRSA